MSRTVMLNLFGQWPGWAVPKPSVGQIWLMIPICHGVVVAQPHSAAQKGQGREGT